MEINIELKIKLEDERLIILSSNEAKILYEKLKEIYDKNNYISYIPSKPIELYYTVTN